MTHLKVHHCISRESTSLAWITPLFELYCVAGPNASRNALAQSANKIVQWVRREEERVFIIGGAVRYGRCFYWLVVKFLTFSEGLLGRSLVVSMLYRRLDDPLKLTHGHALGLLTSSRSSRLVLSTFV